MNVELKIHKTNGLVTKIIFDKTVLFEIDDSPKPYFQVCWSHGWGGEFSSYEEADDYCYSTEGFSRSIREVKPGDEGYIDPGRWMIRTVEIFKVEQPTMNERVNKALACYIDSEKETVREFLSRFFIDALTDIEFDVKRYWGSGHWKFDIFATWISTGLIDGTLDENGYIEHYDREAANLLMLQIVQYIMVERPL